MFVSYNKKDTERKKLITEYSANLTLTIPQGMKTKPLDILLKFDDMVAVCDGDYSPTMIEKTGLSARKFTLANPDKWNFTVNGTVKLLTAGSKHAAGFAEGLTPGVGSMAPETRQEEVLIAQFINDNKATIVEFLRQDNDQFGPKATSEVKNNNI